MKHLGSTKLETDRLILRRYDIQDSTQVFSNWASDSKTTAQLYWNAHKSVTETQEFIKRKLDAYDDSKTYVWVMERKIDKTLIGAIGVVNKNEKDKSCEVAYLLGSKFWNHGYATEALTIVLNHLLYDVEYEVVICNHISTNPASGKVMQKSGMKLDGVLPKRRIDQETGLRVDMYTYSMNKGSRV